GRTSKSVRVARPASRAGQQEGKDRLRFVARTTQGLEANARRRALAVGVADVDADAHFRPASSSCRWPTGAGTARPTTGGLGPGPRRRAGPRHNAPRRPASTPPDTRSPPPWRSATHRSTRRHGAHRRGCIVNQIHLLEHGLLLRVMGYASNGVPLL